MYQNQLELVKHKLLEIPNLEVWGSGLISCIFNKFSNDADAASPGTTL